MARTREFDVDEALEKATRLFWEKGYEATSIQDLVEATGVNRASLYQTYGGKQQLFERALDRFRSQPQQDLDLLTGNTEPGLARIREVFHHAAQQTLRDPRGCLLLNAVAELAPYEGGICSVGRESRERLESFFARCLQEAAQLGEIDPKKSRRAYARFLTNNLFGLRVMAKLQPDRKLVGDIVSTTLDAL